MLCSRALHVGLPALVAVGLVGWSQPVVPSQPADAVDNTAAPAEPGCYLNFVARNDGTRSVFINISDSRIRSWGAIYGVGSYAKISNTPSQNVHAGTTRHFTVWARLCGLAGIQHDVRFALEQGAQKKTITARHDGGNETVSLGKVNSFFN